jgi:hypothetical protein
MALLSHARVSTQDLEPRFVTPLLPPDGASWRHWRNCGLRWWAFWRQRKGRNRCKQRRYRARKATSATALLLSTLPKPADPFDVSDLAADFREA